MDKDLLPERIISASKCICPQFPGPYAIEWAAGSEQEQAQEYMRMGLSASLQTQAQQWATKQLDSGFGWPGVIYTLQGARFAQEYFFPHDDQVILLGIGLPGAMMQTFLDYAAPPPTVPGYSPIAPSGYYQVAKRNVALPSEGTLLGFEPLNTYSGQLEHSWLCNGLENHCSNALGIRPGANGLLIDFGSAQRCCQEISREEVGSEPGLWQPWALVQYS
jgi:hypothetical protein